MLPLFFLGDCIHLLGEKCATSPLCCMEDRTTTTTTTTTTTEPVEGLGM